MQSKRDKKLHAMKGTKKKLSAKDLHAIDNKNFIGSEIMKNDNVFKITNTKRVNGGKDVMLIATKRLNGEKVSPAVTSIKKNPPMEVVRLRK